MNKDELINYRRRLLTEYRDVVLKREKAVSYIENEAGKTGTEKDLKNRELLNRQAELLTEYEEILFCRLMLELNTTN